MPMNLAKAAQARKVAGGDMARPRSPCALRSDRVIFMTTARRGLPPRPAVRGQNVALRRPLKLEELRLAIGGLFVLVGWGQGV